MGKGKKNRGAGAGAMAHNQEDSGASTPTEDEANADGGEGAIEGAAPTSPSRCPHVGKAVHVAALKKSLKTAWTKVGVCSPCAKEQRGAARGAKAPAQDAKKKGGKASEPPPPPQAARPKDPSKPVTVWMCLRCGLQLCDSNSSADHFLKHHQVPRSDLHCVGLNVMTWRLWCQECAAEVHVDSYKKVREAVDFVRKVEETKGRAGGGGGSSSSSSVVSKTSSSSGVKSLGGKSSSSSGGPSTVIPRPRGLSNLGNTCFFNSVMQSLAQTHPLARAADQQSQKGALFEVPEVAVPRAPMPPKKEGDDDDTFDREAHMMAKEGALIEAMSLRLPESGPLTQALTAFLKEMSSVGKMGVVNPGFLFGKLCNRSPQFRGFHQQDAHELLRHLMEGLRSEEVKRQKMAILKQFGLSEKTDPKSVPWATRRKLQALSRHSSYTLMDRMFGGHLVSTIVCEQCHNSSQIYEPFLDLSLPLVEEKPQRPNAKKGKNSVNAAAAVASNGGDDGEDGASGSNNKKKEREMSKKEKRKLKKEKRRQGKQGSQSNKEEEVDKEEVAEKDEEDGDDKAPDNGDDNKRAEEQEDAERDTESSMKEDEQKGENEVDGEELKLTKEMEENEKNKENSPPNSIDDKKDGSSAAENNRVESGEESKTDEKVILSRDSGLVASKMSVFDAKKDKKASGKEPADGNEEDDEDDGYSEGEEDWEWDYGEEWEEGDEEKKDGEEDKGDEKDDGKSVYLEVEAAPKPKEKLVSLNPLPPERLARGSSEREKSSDPTGENDDGADSSSDGSGTSVVGDVEDNLEEPQPTIPASEDPRRKPSLASGRLRSSIAGDDDETRRLLEQLRPFRPDPEHLDPHMEELCRKVRRLSVASVHVQSFSEGGGASGSFAPDDPSRKYSVGVNGLPEGEATASTASSETTSLDLRQREQNSARLRNDWVARSLTSIAPRYHAKAGECSVYSCLTQFTAPELLTGNNKWACDKCTQLQAARRKVEASNGETNGVSSSESSDEEEEKEEGEEKELEGDVGEGEDEESKVDAGDSGEAIDTSKSKKEKKPKEKKPPPTVYSNASKQLLIFSPPAVLTIHLKRFQQTLYNLRKVNRHVQFPLSLDLAPFCSSTALSAPSVSAGAAAIRYELFALVEHSGRLQGGHYTACVKVRPAAKEAAASPATSGGAAQSSAANQYERFYSQPAAKTEEIHSLLAEIERKYRELALSVASSAAASADKEETESGVSSEEPQPPPPPAPSSPPAKWFSISDSHVSEVSEDKVLKSQAYLLFYERVE